ncbi:hypothetical protein CONCODRAFT_72180 [Conidiobolus coronatus NRRL 28638]|uniref:Zn(2)-C6 fungal-type domain-containing protein n=1 Tax=Conidiobolus coronatus (strain ATCC 28846 / CBS 209.66 / NRRL 28638) TaxID=796925 RepID=A0A137P0W9_CONC2|nr:hypothetical protein CONCODRAFT_72180 [Conidiobolus coronatus NRRL 28638]|eukprot:KXN68524.1 hypothetical protein CONCODRAFT_72180 [Conidiobolus coronatus NRRL 28638]
MKDFEHLFLNNHQGHQFSHDKDTSLNNTSLWNEMGDLLSNMELPSQAIIDNFMKVNPDGIASEDDGVALDMMNRNEMMNNYNDKDFAGDVSSQNQQAYQTKMNAIKFNQMAEGPQRETGNYHEEMQTQMEPSLLGLNDDSMGLMSYPPSLVQQLSPHQSEFCLSSPQNSMMHLFHGHNGHSQNQPPTPTQMHPSIPHGQNMDSAHQNLLNQGVSLNAALHHNINMDFTQPQMMKAVRSNAWKSMNYNHTSAYNPADYQQMPTDPYSLAYQNYYYSPYFAAGSGAHLPYYPEGLEVMENPHHNSFDSIKVKRHKNVGRACIHCKKAHLACDEARPCKRCVHLGKSNCIDVEHKRRGRPKSVQTKAKAAAAAAAAAQSSSGAPVPQSTSMNVPMQTAPNPMM